jgi:hypothetical protein
MHLEIRLVLQCRRNMYKSKATLFVLSHPNRPTRLLRTHKTTIQRWRHMYVCDVIYLASKNSEGAVFCLFEFRFCAHTHHRHPSISKDDESALVGHSMAAHWDLDIHIYILLVPLHKSVHTWRSHFSEILWFYQLPADLLQWVSVSYTLYCKWSTRWRPKKSHKLKSDDVRKRMWRLGIVVVVVTVRHQQAWQQASVESLSLYWWCQTTRLGAEWHSRHKTS